MLEHTPTPWNVYPDCDKIIVDSDDAMVCSVSGTAPSMHERRDFIVRAVNNHERLLEACKMAAGALALIQPNGYDPEWYVNAINDAKKLCAEAIGECDSPSADDPSAVPLGRDLNNPGPN